MPVPKPKVQKDAVQQAFGAKWFFPLLKRLELLESETLSELFPEVAPVLEPDAPAWAVKCLEDGYTPDSECIGLDDAPNLDSRRFGRMIGAKWALFEAQERMHPVWKALKPKEIQKIEDVWEKGFVSECISFSGRFVEKFTPEMRWIKEKAIKLVQARNNFEELQYLSGFVEGSRILERIRKRMGPAKNKRQADSQKRNCVFLFAVFCGDMIENNKAQLSWPELHQMLQDFTDGKVEVDEDALKQILFRRGLKGVGKTGRPIPLKL